MPKLRNKWPLVLGIAATICIGVWLAVSGSIPIGFEKLATALLMPTGIVWILLFLILVGSLRVRQWGLALLAGVGWLVVSFAGNGFISTWLVGSLEAPYAQINPLEQGVFDAVIVLGGGSSMGVNGRDQGNGSGDRVILAAQMFHQGLARKLICTGRRISEADSPMLDPAQSSATVLRGLGVPEEAIEYTSGRNTHEEMKILADQFTQSKDRPPRIGLITSAWHLPRALRLAKKCGFSPEPLPAGFFTGMKSQEWTLEALVPTVDAFTVTRVVVKERLAGFVGR